METNLANGEQKHNHMVDDPPWHRGLTRLAVLSGSVCFSNWSNSWQNWGLEGNTVSHFSHIGRHTWLFPRNPWHRHRQTRTTYYSKSIARIECITWRIQKHAVCPTKIKSTPSSEPDSGILSGHCVGSVIQTGLGFVIKQTNKKKSEPLQPCLNRWMASSELWLTFWSGIHLRNFDGQQLMVGGQQIFEAHVSFCQKIKQI